jgi:hypothetical protein
MNKLYYQQDNGAVYIHLDGGLRHIPNPKTFGNLFEGSINPDSCIQFPNAGASPLPIFNQWPIADNALLVETSDPTCGILLQDKYPWEDTFVLRHVISPTQMNEIGFDWHKVVKISENINIGVPLTIESNTNINAEQNLSGYYSVYNYLIVGGSLNPFFNYLLTHFKGHSSAGSNQNRKFRAPLKALIAKYKQKVNNFPGTVKYVVNKEQTQVVA